MAGPSASAPDWPLINRLIDELLPWYARAERKHAFDVSVTALATIVPFTLGRIAALMIPAGSIWVGGDGGLTVNNGLPLIAGQVFSFGPEEGESFTWAITTTGLSPVDLRCFELL